MCQVFWQSGLCTVFWIQGSQNTPHGIERVGVLVLCSRCLHISSPMYAELRYDMWLTLQAPELQHL